MTRAELLAFLRRSRLAVEATVSPAGAPQAAVVGVAFTEQLEIVFDTLVTSRKGHNLRHRGRIALVVGWDEEQTAQIEGDVDEPSGDALARCKAAYFRAFPDGLEREKWPNIVYFRVRPTWLRYSDYRAGERIVELDAAALSALV